MTVQTASTSRLDSIAEPTAADLAAMEVEVAEAEVTDWESLLPEVIDVAPKSDEDFWAEDENVHDDRWDSGIPSWSAWA